MLLLACFLGYALYRERATIEAIEGERLQLQARVIEENLASQMGGVAAALMAGIVCATGEERMLQLRSEVNEVLTRQGQPRRYSVDAASSTDDK